MMALYPGFGGKTSSTFRTQRLETGSQRLQRGQIRPTAGNYVRTPIASVSTASNASQTLDLSKSHLRKIGGVSNNGSTGAFGWTSTGTSITWYWDGTNASQQPVIHRADGSNFTVPTAGSGLTVTGLANATDYYFLPFWSVANFCNLGWVEGTVGAPPIAFVLADVNGNSSSFYTLQQTLQGREPLSNGFMKATTAAGGGSGGGGNPTCVRSGSRIETLGSLPYDCDVLAETDWIYLETEQGKELFCTADHPLYHAVNGRVPADTLVVGDLVITNEGEQRLVTAEPRHKKCSKYHIRMERGHLFFANGFLSHNQKIHL